MSADYKQNFTVSLTKAEASLIWKAAAYARMRPEDFIVAAARYTIEKAEKNATAILKLRAEEEELCGVKRND